MSRTNVRKLRAKVLDVRKTGEEKIDASGVPWQKCVLTVELIGLSKRAQGQDMRAELLGKKVHLIRWCSLDWHYTVGVRRTLGLDETDAVFQGRPTSTAYW